MNQKISVIVPVYNTEKYLEKCVQSILNQTYENLQIILINDGSTDRSPEICDKFAGSDSRVTVVHKENGGLSSARNAGIEAATGDYLGFIDSDDFISPDMYELLLKNAGSSDKEISNVMYVRSFDDGSERPSVVPHTNDEKISSEQFIRELMLHTGDVSVCTKLFPKSLFKERRFQEGKYNEDLLFIIDLLGEVENINFVGSVGYYYYTRSGSISSGYGKAIEDMVGNSVVAMESVKEKYPQLKEEAERFALYQHMAYLLLLPESLANKNNQIYSDAVKFVRKYFPRNLRNKYLNLKNKIILLCFTVAPKASIKLFRAIKK